MNLSPRRTSLLGLLALLPLALYWVGVPKIELEPALSVVCVLLIVGSLRLMFSAAEGANGAAH